MPEPTPVNHARLTQLRMGILGAVSAVVLCFGAAVTFAGDSAQANTAPPSHHAD